MIEGMLTEGTLVEVEAAPDDITITLAGPRAPITAIDGQLLGCAAGEAGGNSHTAEPAEAIALYTAGYGGVVRISDGSTAVQVGADNRVLRIMPGSAGSGDLEDLEDLEELDIPAGGYVLMDCHAAGGRSFLATYIKAADVLRLRMDGRQTDLGEMLGMLELKSGLQFGEASDSRYSLRLDNYPMHTVAADEVRITGKATGAGVGVIINEHEVSVAADSTFSCVHSLQSGVNYVKTEAVSGGVVQAQQSLVIYRKQGDAVKLPGQRAILWVDQTANARRFATSEDVRALLLQAQESGVTDIALDAKGVEGFVSYKKATLTGRPYVSEIKAPGKAGASPELDLLQEFIAHGHSLGLRIHAAINAFAEGSIYRDEYAVLDNHLDWEERVYKHQDGGAILRQRESAAPGLVAFANPLHDEVRAFQLATYREVMENYNIDGIIHDRTRYDNEAADFSELSRVRFEAFLAREGKALSQWPEDVFRYEGNTRINGPLVCEWWAFRAAVITSFMAEVKAMADGIGAQKGRAILVSAYVGSWYEGYYLNGANWASPQFRNDSRLGLPDSYVYTEAYRQTGYTNHLDFLMIGCYQDSQAEIEKYMTIGNIVTNGEIPLYTGIALNSVPDPGMLREVLQSGLRNTAGVMLFDASYADWQAVAAALG